VSLLKLFASILIFIQFGCASYLSQSQKTRAYLQSGQIDLALQDLKDKADVSGKDQLIYLLDYSTVLQIKGEYEASAKAFQKADKLIDENDYHSVSQMVGATLGSEEMIQYKGESYEKFMVNSLNAINYLMLGDHDSALVECRRINNKISSFKMEQREPYELSPFARYLSAVIWESERKYDDAYIEYEGAYKLDPKIPFIQSDLIRSAYLAQKPEQVKKWKKEFELKSNDNELNPLKDKSLGELVVIFQQGFGAKKIPRYDEPRFPTLQSEILQTQMAQVQIEDQNDFVQVKTINIQTKTIYDIDQMAKETLTRDYNSLIARRLGALAAKAVMSDQIRQKNQLLGDLAWIAMNIADRADLRQWSTLPSKIQMARVFLKPGRYKIKVEPVGDSGSAITEAPIEMNIQIKSGKKAFVNYRSLR